MRKWLIAVFPAVVLFWSGAALAQMSVINGIGSTTHSAVTTAYTAGELFANNTEWECNSGNDTGEALTPSGQGLAWHAMMESSGTNQPPEIDLWLYSGVPLTTGLVDYSAYVGPYQVDLTSGIFLGKLICNSWAKTNDGTAKYWSECTSSNGVFGPMPFKAVAGLTTINVLEEINGSYTPLSSEVHTYLFSTSRDN